MTVKIDTKFEGKLTCASKNDMFSLKHVRKSKNLDIYWILIPKVENI